jgi:hypothetical protein
MTDTKRLSCTECDAKFDNRHALAGHIGSAHRRELVPIPHGEERGYIYHIRRGVPFPEDEGEEPCGCRKAHAHHHAQRRRQRIRTRIHK